MTGLLMLISDYFKPINLQIRFSSQCFLPSIINIVPNYKKNRLIFSFEKLFTIRTKFAIKGAYQKSIDKKKKQQVEETVLAFLINGIGIIYFFSFDSKV